MQNFYVEVTVIEGEFIRRVSYLVNAYNGQMAGQAAINSEAYSNDLDWSGEYVNDTATNHKYRSTATPITEMEAVTMGRYVRRLMADGHKLYSSGNFRLQPQILAVSQNMV